MANTKEKIEVLLINPELCKYILKDNGISYLEFAQSCGCYTAFAVRGWFLRQEYLRNYQIRGIVSMIGWQDLLSSIQKFKMLKASKKPDTSY